MKFKKSEVLDITGFYGLLLRCMKIREIGRSPTMPNFIYLHISLKKQVISRVSGFLILHRQILDIIHGTCRLVIAHAIHSLADFSAHAFPLRLLPIVEVSFLSRKEPNTTHNISRNSSFLKLFRRLLPPFLPGISNHYLRPNVLLKLFPLCVFPFLKF